LHAQEIIGCLRGATQGSLLLINTTCLFTASFYRILGKVKNISQYWISFSPLYIKVHTHCCRSFNLWTSFNSYSIFSMFRLNLLCATVAVVLVAMVITRAEGQTGNIFY